MPAPQLSPTRTAARPCRAALLGDLSEVIVMAPRLCSSLVSGSIALLCVAPTAANVNLEWRSGSTSLCVDNIVHVALYAVSDNPNPQAMAAIDVIMDWDPSHLQLLGLIDDGPYDWLFSGFPNDAGLDNLNGTFSDGDAFYEALARLGNPAQATAPGLHVTTFRFRVLAAGSPSKLEMVPSRGSFTFTRVYSGVTAGLIITGTIDSDFLAIAERGDTNCDGTVDFFDIDPLLLAIFDPVTYTNTFCNGTLCAADTDCSGFVDFFDIDPFLACLFAMCPPCP